MRKVVFLLIPLLGACAGPEIWDKPGGSQSEFEIDRYACDSQALAAYPINIQPQETGQQIHCNSYGYSTDCTVEPTYAPTSPFTVIANSLDRNNMFNSCMNARGYTLRQ